MHAASQRLLASAALFLFSTGLASSAFAACPFGASPETAQRVFDRAKAIPLAGGYRFEGLGTNKTEMRLQWSLDGQACPPIRVELESCAPLFGSPALQVHPPPELLDRCPRLQDIVHALSGAESERLLTGRHRWLRRAAGIVLLLIVGLGAARAVGKIGGRIVGWSVFALAVAMPFIVGVPVAATLAFGAAWMAFTVLVWDRPLLAAASRAGKLVLLGLFTFSLLLDWSLSSGGPGDLHLNLAGIWSPELELRWGPAPVALYRALGFVLGGIRDTDIVWCNLLLSSLLPILLYTIVLELGVGSVAALLAAFVVAAHPLLIVFSGVLGRQPTYLFAAFGSLLALIIFLKRGAWSDFTAFVLGTALAITSRPEGAHVLVFDAAVWLLLPANRRARRPAAFAIGLLLCLAFVYARYALGSHSPGGSSFIGRAPFLWTVLLDRNFTPIAWIVAWGVGLVLGVRHRAASVALLVLFGLDLTWRWTGLYHMFVGHERQVASARYESVLLLPFGIGIALFFQAWLPVRSDCGRGVARGSWWRLGVATAFVGFTLATFGRPYTTLLMPFTIDYEYQFLRRHALALPPQSRLHILDAPFDDVGFIDAHLVGLFAGSPVAFLTWSNRRCEDLIRDGSPTYVYIGSSCAELIAAPNHALPSPGYGSWLRDCAAMRARLANDPVEEVHVAARKMSWHDFKNRTVRLGIYRLNDPSLCALGPRWGK